MKIFLSVALLIGAVSGVKDVNAASYSASVFSSGPLTPPCNRSAFESNEVELQCPGVRAIASPGRLGVAATATSTTTSRSGATALFIDSLMFGIREGTFEFELDLLGATKVSTLELGWPGEALAKIGASFAASGAGGSDSLTLGSLVVHTAYPTQGFQVTTTGDPDVVTSLVVPFTDGFMRINGKLTAETSCVVPATSCSAVADFISSLRFVGGVLRDADGNISTASVTSDSGFDYVTGIQPHDRGSDPTPVPVPAALPLLAAGLGALGLMGWRRKRVV